MFNHEIAQRISKSISRMDPDEAEMFARFFVYEVHKTDIENNRRTLDRHIIDVSKRLTGALEEISKWKAATPYELEYGKPQPRKSGRWAKTSGGTPKKRKFEISYERSKGGGEGYHLNVNDFDVTSALSNTNREANKFQEAWTRSDRTDPGTNDQLYRRIAAGGKLLQALPSDQAKLAGSVGVFAGNMGPEAEKVIGPAARRTAYRYRGTERMPDETLYKLHDRVLDNESRRLGIGSQSITPEIRMATAEDAAKAYLVKRLPSKQLSKLQMESGKLPPSEGVIINADGDIVTQAVGYNEDHYLPFNLKNLKGLQGGSYVRTRSTGGLTSEDIYTGLIAGARSVTVVSRTGVFTLDFNDDLRGGRRYSDKARQMVGQYARTLDSVGSGKVARRGLSPAERAQIREEVEDEYKTLGYTAEEIETEIRQREKAYQGGIRFTKEEIEEVDAQAKKLADEWTPLGSKSSSGGERTDAINAKPDKVPVNDEARFRYFRSELMDGLMDEKEARMYQLDADGYSDAMKALKEQFPYFIDNVEMRKLTDRHGNPAQRTERDSGYVRPRYNRPKEVRSGYFDEEIEGKGKYSAADTNYQNWGVRNQGKQNRDKENDSTAEETPMQQKRDEKAKAKAKAIQIQAQDLLVSTIKQPAVMAGAAISSADVRQHFDQNEYRNLIASARYDDAKWDSLTIPEVLKIHNELEMLRNGGLSGFEQSNPKMVKAVEDALDQAKVHVRNMAEEIEFKESDWDFDTPVPDKAFSFRRGTKGHDYGQSPEDYETAWNQVIGRKLVGAWATRMGITDPSTTDDALKLAQQRAQAFGSAAVGLKAAMTSGDSRAIRDATTLAARTLTHTGVDPEKAVDMVKDMSDQNPSRPGYIDQMIESARAASLGIAELRDIKKYASGTVERQRPMNPGEENQPSVAGQVVAPKAIAAESESTTSKSVAKFVNDMAQSLSKYNSDIARADRKALRAVGILLEDDDVEAAYQAADDIKDEQSKRLIKESIKDIGK